MRIASYIFLLILFISHLVDLPKKENYYGSLFFFLGFWSIVILLIYLYEKNKKNKKKAEEKRKKELIDAYLNRKNEVLNKLRTLENTTKNQYKIIEFQIAGLFYRPTYIHEIAQRINEGQTLTLEREPYNKYDKYAVRIMYGNNHIGYVPQSYSESVSENLKNKEDYFAVVIDNSRAIIPHIYIKLIPIENRSYFI